MPELKPLQHQDADRKDDGVLRREAEVHLAESPALQLVAELLLKLRTRALPWWTPDDLRVCWNATERMRWFRERADLREQITTSLTSLAPKAARKKTPEFQGGLLDSFIEDGDISIRQFEDAFDPFDIAVYGPASEFFRKFRERMPWDQDTPVHQEIMGWLIKALLADRSTLRGLTRKPILTAWEVRAAIPGAVWQARIPLDVRVAIDEARLQRERAGEPFCAAHELAIATPEVLANSIPLRELTCVLEVAQKAMGCDTGTTKLTAATESRSVSERPDGRIATPIPNVPNITTIDPPLLDPDQVLASISRRAANATPRASTPPPPHPASVSGRTTRRPLVEEARWPEDSDEHYAMPVKRRDDDATQPRAQMLAR